MGHFCWVCDRIRSNESFSGQGHARHLCRTCSRVPHDAREAIRARRDLWRILEQSNISQRSLQRAADLQSHPQEEIASMARLVIEIGLAHPRRKGRFKYLRRQRPALFRRIESDPLLSTVLIPFDLGDDARTQYDGFAEGDWPAPAERVAPDDADEDIPF
jgi:hypothetical protein